MNGYGYLKRRIEFMNTLVAILFTSTVGLVLFYLATLKIALDPSFTRLTNKKVIVCLILSVSMFIGSIVYGLIEGIIPLETYNSKHEINDLNNNLLLVMISYLFVYPLIRSKNEKSKKR
jgi:hypothetical protein